jgi:hypothetical protein
LPLACGHSFKSPAHHAYGLAHGKKLSDVVLSYMKHGPDE